MPLIKLKNKIDNFDTVEIVIKYNLGGINYFGYKEEKRGYYIHFIPCNVRIVGTSTIRETVLFHDRSFKLFIYPINRKSDKRLKMLQEVLNKHIDKLIEQYEISNEAAVSYITNIMHKDFYNG